MKPFLTAEWVNLILVSWNVNPDVLIPFLPKGTELDLYRGDAFVTMIAFEFRHTRIRGFAVPFHVDFPEINLRFYAKAGDARGVVFIREFVPLPMVAWAARMRYNEPYACRPMRCRVTHSAETMCVEHTIRCGGMEHTIRAEGGSATFLPEPTSLEHFLKEHGRGYGTSRAGTTLMYGVAHRLWPVHPVTRFECDVDFSRLYGDRWGLLGKQKPHNVTLAQGSAVQVFSPAAL